MALPPLRNTAAVKLDFANQSVWPFSRRNLTALPSELYSRIQATVPQLGDVTRIRMPSNLLDRIQRKKLDISSVSVSDLRACLESLTFSSGNVLDLGMLQRVSRGPLKVIANILTAWLVLKFPSLGKIFGRQQYDYAFMVHPRDYSDILSGVPFLSILPKKWGRAIVKRLPPFMLSTMTGIKDVNGKELTGALLCVGWDRKMFETDKRGRFAKISDMVRLAKRLGIKYAGFAALLPWASGYGKCCEGVVAKSEIVKIFGEQDLTWKAFFTNPEDPSENLIFKPEARSEILQKVTDRNKRKSILAVLERSLVVNDELKDMTITTGHPFTVMIIASFVAKILELHAKRKAGQEPLIAIVGAGGSTGSCCARKLLEVGARNFLLNDKIKSTGVISLADLQEEMTRTNSQARVVTSTEMSDLRQADIIIVVSSASGTILDSQFIKPGAVVVDDSQPRNVDPKIAKERSDIRVITVLSPLGGLIPNFNFDRHTPFTDASFTCCGDVSLRARTQTEVRATGPATMAGVKVVEEMIKRCRQEMGFDPVEPILFTYERKVIAYDDLAAVTGRTL